MYNGEVPADLSIMDTHISDNYISTISAPLIVLFGEEVILNQPSCANGTQKLQTLSTDSGNSGTTLAKLWRQL